MTKLGLQPTDEEKKDEIVKPDVVKDPKVFTVVQPTFVPIPIQQNAPQKHKPSTTCLLIRFAALIFVSALLLTLVVHLIYGSNVFEKLYSPSVASKSIVESSEPQFQALNSQALLAAQKKDDDKKAQITIMKTDEGTQMIVQLPHAQQEESQEVDEDKDEDEKTTTEAEKSKEIIIPIFQLGAASTNNNEDSSAESQNNRDEQQRPMHPYEMEAPSPDALNFQHSPWAMMEARRQQYENEMRMLRFRRVQQMMMMAAAQQQRENAMRYAAWQRQQWMQHQMAAAAQMQRQQQWEQWHDYWRRVAMFRAMQQQQAVGPATQQFEQPRPYWIQQQQQWPQQQQPMMMQPQQQQPMFFWHQQQPQFMQQQQPQFGQPMQQQQPQQPLSFEEQQQRAQVPQSQPNFLFQQSAPAQEQQQDQQQQQQQPQEQPQQGLSIQVQQQQPQQQGQEEEQPVHSFILIRRFFPIPQDQQASNSAEESNDKSVPLRPHDASAQQIVDQMKGTSNIPPAPIPSIHDRIFQHFQSIAQRMQEANSAQSRPPLFNSVPKEGEQQPQGIYDQDSIYNQLQKKAMLMQNVDSSSPATATLEDADRPIDDDIHRGDAVLTSRQEAPMQSGEVGVTTTTEPVMIENLARAQSREETKTDSSEDELTPEEKQKIASLDSGELREAAALESQLKEEAKDVEQKRAEAEKALLAIMEEAKKDSSEEQQDDDHEDHEPVTLATPTTNDPMAEFFRFILRNFESEAVKLSEDQDKPQRVVVDSETNDDSSADSHSAEKHSDEVQPQVEATTEIVTKPDIELLPSEEAPQISLNKSGVRDEVASQEETESSVANDADIKVSSASNSFPLPRAIATAA